MSTLRFKVVEEAYGRKAVPVAIPSERPNEYYGKYVFNRAQMYKYLDKDTYDALVYAIDNKEPLSRRLADRVAAGDCMLCGKCVDASADRRNSREA